MFTHTSNLKVHIRSCHKAEVGETHRGASSMEESIAAMSNSLLMHYAYYLHTNFFLDYWTSHLAFLKGVTDDVDLNTPHKGSKVIDC